MTNPPTPPVDEGHLGNALLDYLTDQFPAVIGHLPLVDKCIEIDHQLTTLRAQLSASEKQIDQLITERDDAEQAMSQAYYLITGRSPEWSNHFGYQQANEDIDDAQRLLRAQLAAMQEAVKGQIETWSAQADELCRQSENCSVDPLLARQKADCDSKDWMLRNCISELEKLIL